ncbi:hypothetical protein NFI96_007411 [Prochilodus magdalenae]|nr:hypothetical protein NFI96_007411 [Prochilodus magdalenae]
MTVWYDTTAVFGDGDVVLRTVVVTVCVHVVLRGAAVCRWCCTNRRTHGGHHCSLEVNLSVIMESILDPSALPDPTPTVTYNPKSETVTFPSRVVSVAGVTVVTGGTEMSWGSCLLAFGFWGTLVGISMVAVGLWDYSMLTARHTSLLLILGLVVLAFSSSVVCGVFGFRFLMRKRGLTRREREEGKFVLVAEEGTNVIKAVTV